MEHFRMPEFERRSNTPYGELYNRLLAAEQLVMPPKEGESQPPNIDALLIIKNFLAKLNDWVETSQRLPTSGMEVLTWSPDRQHRVGYWVKRDDLPDGRYWVIEGASGGIGTAHEIRPPTHWMPLPTSPHGGGLNSGAKK